MSSRIKIKQTIAIWLSAILIVLSVAASAHSVRHLDDGVKNHCTLCFHQLHLNKTLQFSSFVFAVTKQTFELQQYTLPPFSSVFHRYYHSRAPPQSL
ncbi:ABC-type zinc uptake system zinc chaperone [Shewanella vesiculosa]|uniref:ABC-type zinc uptake system zinc chaperone n=1 Tax=Shewanella TaxID=22 RepID=UPI000F4ECEFF|nr:MULTISPECIES: ABC-type zinc uptake system zinc chaperone [Shewanella]MBB1390295.1 ABC-type zinc uptake system zinc chaperone [Shewanella sp. SG44-6]MBB1475411.1 ABC-type zinc uptake system zinc chaperone [Shewanella sp. SG41-3]RPA56071.1 ABC-type zinc uptake system zinc chaperone [Shewanella vesiculosa]